MLSSVQALGRTGLTALGVGRGGAADPLSLRVGNRLLGNEDDAASVEMTWIGGTFVFEGDAWIVLTGSEMDASIETKSYPQRVSVGQPVRVQSGECLRAGRAQFGVRTYLCVAGGIDVPLVLGSRSTQLIGGFGGLCGRALRDGDVLPIGAAPPIEPSESRARHARALCSTILNRRSLRAVDGVQSALFTQTVVNSFWSSRFEVSMQSDRAGLRLSGRIGESAFCGRMPSEGMMPGAVQVPESGEPIVLHVDHPTTGGYPVIACVAAVDHAVLGQIPPREQVRFDRVSVDEARALYRAQEQALDATIPPCSTSPRSEA